MRRETINRITAIAPMSMSLLAFGIASASVITGWERSLKDEGAAAHLFQLLIVLQIPLIAAFLMTADWRRLRAIAWVIVLQAAAQGFALGTLALFRL